MSFTRSHHELVCWVRSDSNASFHTMVSTLFLLIPGFLLTLVEEMACAYGIETPSTDRISRVYLPKSPKKALHPLLDE